MRFWWRKSGDNGANNAALLARLNQLEVNIVSLFQASLNVLEAHQATLEDILHEQRRLGNKVDALTQAVASLEAVASAVASKVVELKGQASDPAALDALSARVAAAVQALQAAIA